jgi:hypothetical protein
VLEAYVLEYVLFVLGIGLAGVGGVHDTISFFVGEM